MNKKIRGLISITLAISLLLLNGCGSDKESENVSVKEPVKKEQSDSVTKETDNGEETDTVDSAVSEKDAGEKKKDLSLAERMCGKYSYHSGGSDGNEFFTLDVISFGNNLYAMGGEAMGDDSDSLEPYSFWAMEFIPNNKEDLKSTTSLKADLNILEFSIMSNQSQYFNTRAQDGSVELTADGLVFNGFDGSGDGGFLNPVDDSRLFLRDERVSDVFSYVSDSDQRDSDLNGLWKLKNGEYPVFLKFEGKNLYIYCKEPDKEVFFGGGSYTISDGSVMELVYSTLGNGDMPSEWKAGLVRKGDSLTVITKDDSCPSVLDNNAEFERADESDIPAITAEETVLGRIHSDHDEDINMLPSRDDKGFFGVFVSTSKDRDAAIEDAKKLNEEGFLSSVCYTPEWGKLNPEPWFAALAGRCETEDEAEKLLSDVKEKGYDDAYVKYSGKCLRKIICYTCYGENSIDFLPDKVVIKNVSIDSDKEWYPLFEEDTSTGGAVSLIVDKDTVFDESANMDFFGNYEEGDTVLQWFNKNRGENIGENGDIPALVGIFEVGVMGNHIDRFYGSYWWD